MRRSPLRPLDLFEGQEEGPTKQGGDDGLPGAAKNAGDNA
jgi:hypothetical protein